MLPNKEANVFVAGIDAYTRYVVPSVVNSCGELVVKPTRVRDDGSIVVVRSRLLNDVHVAPARRDLHRRS